MAENKFGRRLMQRKEVEVEVKNTKARGILALVFLAIGVVFLAIGVKSCAGGEPGWRDITSTSGQTNCSSDFVLQYYFPDDDTDLVELNGEVTALYTETTEKAYKLFYADAPANNGGLRDINAKPNETVTVDGDLYAALTQICNAGDRQIYLAPVLVEYARVFQSEDAVTAEERDPARNPELMPYITQLAGYANDPAMIDLKLLGDNQVQLFVSAEYLAFAQEYELEAYLDFGWMRNAFICDYIAQKFIDKGLNRGHLSSYDGFTRVMDGSGEIYGLNLFDRKGNDIYIPAITQYVGPASLVFVRNYPLSISDKWGFYVHADGTTVHTMIDPADGVCKSSTDNIMAMSGSASCSQMVLELAPVFIADQLDEQALIQLQKQEILCVWFEDDTLKYTGQLAIRNNDDGETPIYKIQKAD